MNRYAQCLMPILLTLLSLPIRAAAHDEAAFPVEYEVLSAKMSWHLLGDICTMTVRDVADPSLNFTVERKSDTCEVPKVKTLHGRRVKGKIQFLGPNDRGILKVENWTLTEDKSSGKPK
jgi:hypothetical protein